MLSSWFMASFPYSVNSYSNKRERGEESAAALRRHYKSMHALT